MKNSDGSLWSFLTRVALHAVAALSLSGSPLHAQTASASPSTSAAGTPAGMLILPAGTKVVMAATRAVWAAKVKAGDPLYLETVFPVTIGNRIAIPAGTYVSATIDAVQQPTRKMARAELEVRFNQMVFAGGYAVALAGTEGSGPLPSAGNAARAAPASGGTATRSLVTVQVERDNDILLDNGSQMEMTLAAPLALDAAKIAWAVGRSHAPPPGSFKPATLCRPTPGDPGTAGTPGTPDTVIPGSPGTPDISIPGPDGTSTTIPGTPATPPTVIPGSPGTAGTPGTPGTFCPASPLVISSTPGGTIPAAQVRATPSTKKTRLQDGKEGQ